MPIFAAAVPFLAKAAASTLAGEALKVGYNHLKGDDKAEEKPKAEDNKNPASSTDAKF